MSDDVAGAGYLTHCGLVTPHDDRSWSTLAQVMVRCLTLPEPKLTNHQLGRSCGIYLRAISQEMIKISILDVNLENYKFRITTTSPRGQ